MTQTYNHFPTFLVTIFASRKMTNFFSRLGILRHACGPPRDWWRRRYFRDFVIPSDLVILAAVSCASFELSIQCPFAGSVRSTEATRQSRPSS